MLPILPIIINIKYNIALALLKNGQYDVSKKRFDKILDLSVLNKKPALKSRVLDMRAFAKSKLNDPTAEKELLEALALKKEIKDYNGQFASYIHLTEHYQSHNQYSTALEYAKKAYKIAKKIKSADAQTEALSYLIQLEENPKKAAVKYQRLTDSITTARQQAKNQFAKIKIRHRKKPETCVGTLCRNRPKRSETCPTKQSTVMVDDNYYTASWYRDFYKLLSQTTNQNGPYRRTPCNQ